ncbi:MAG TPA: class I SAM-dependent methyltransferase [Thermodesulfobacteriota bacterium]|nr:class I SAM-dependent methyltransferase [Thermodesulfobacteriota bacterium]
MKLSGARPGDHVLDVGCGPGSLALALKASIGPVGSIHGVDASPEMIERARRNAVKAGKDVDFRVGLAEALPFPEKSFNLVVSQLVMHHLPGDLKTRVFREMARVVKPQGRCLIVDFEPPKSKLLRSLLRLVDGHGMMETDVRGYGAMMEEAGFTEIEAGPTRHPMLAFIRGEIPATHHNADQ